MSETEAKSSKRTSDEDVLAISTARGARGAALKAVTANRLVDGLVVYLGANDWVETIAAARSVEGKEAAAALLAEAEPDVAACRIVGPYIIDVVPDEAGTLRATSERERIRALGPTTRPDLGKQAEA
ncbi:MAG: DUF2849 domain-containing protein [Rhodospirillales bacterium]